MINEHYFVEAQGKDKSNYVINVQKPPFMVARVYKWRTNSNGAEEVKKYMAKFPNSVQVEGYNVVLAYDSVMDNKALFYREEIDIELHRMAAFYLSAKIDNAPSYYKHYKI